MHRRTVRFDAASTVWTWKPFLSVLQVFTINFTVYTMYTQIKRLVNWRVFCGPHPTNHWKLTHAVNILINDSRMFMHDFTFIHLVFLRYMHGAQSLRFALQYSNDCSPPPLTPWNVRYKPHFCMKCCNNVRWIIPFVTWRRRRAKKSRAKTKMRKKRKRKK